LSEFEKEPRMAIADLSTTTTYTYDKIMSVLGNQADNLLNHTPKVSKDVLHLPSPNFIDEVWAA